MDRPDYKRLTGLIQPESGFGFSNFRPVEEILDSMGALNPTGYAVATLENERHINKLFSDKHSDYNLIDENKDDENYIYRVNTEERCLLMDLFFSRKNLKHIQNIIISIVYQKINIKISEQNENIILDLMRRTYINSPVNKLANSTNVTQELIKLNKNIVDMLVPDVISGIYKHLGFIKDHSNLPWIMDRPVNSSVAGTRVQRGFDSLLL